MAVIRSSLKHTITRLELHHIQTTSELVKSEFDHSTRSWRLTTDELKAKSWPFDVEMAAFHGPNFCVIFTNGCSIDDGVNFL